MTLVPLSAAAQTANASLSPSGVKKWKILGVFISLVAGTGVGTRSVRVSLRRNGSAVGSEIANTGSQTTVSTTFYGTGDVAAASSPLVSNTVSLQWGAHPEVTLLDLIDITAVLISGDTFSYNIIVLEEDA